MSVVSRFVAPLLISTSFASVATAQDEFEGVAATVPAQDPSAMVETYTKTYDCSDELVQSGEVGPTPSQDFNQMWNLDMCGEFEGAEDILFSLPTAKGAVDDKGYIVTPKVSDNDQFSECYYARLPFGKNAEIIRTKNTVDSLFGEADQNTYTIEYGPYAWPAEDYETVHNAITARCIPQI